MENPPRMISFLVYTSLIPVFIEFADLGSARHGSLAERCLSVRIIA